MFTKKFLSGLLCFALLISTLSISAFAFPDVDNDPTVAWAVPYINEMSELGYIKGYEDGTFKPTNTISKTEALILLSRMVGVNDESFADSVEMAQKKYSSVLSKYSTNYEKEVSFLLYMGILESGELDSYLSNSNKNAPLLRYEAAVLLTKLLGADEEVESNAFVSSSYADTLEIPDSARAYVEYVNEKEIMQGMGNDENGDPIFSPNTSVTRAQMAKMLYCLIDIIDLSVQTGTVVSTDAFNETITVTINNNDIVNKLNPGSKYKLNGEDVELSDLKRGMHIKLVHIAGTVALIENQVINEDTIVYGLVSATSETTNSKTVTIVDANDSKKKDTYILADNAKIRVNGAIDTFGKIKANNYVALTIEDGLVATLEVIDKTATTYGTLDSIDFSGEYTVLEILTTNGEIESLEVSDSDVQITRNGLAASLSDLVHGDSVSIKLTYGKVTKIQASSKSSNNSGVIDYITYTKTGTTIGIEINGEVCDYKVNKSATVTMDSFEGATVYDLRPGTDIEIKLDSNEIVKIEATATVAKSQVTGTVKTINTSYGLLVIQENGAEYNIFANSTTKIIDSTTGKTVLLKSIEKGRTASVTGSNASGVFEASVIVLQ